MRTQIPTRPDAGGCGRRLLQLHVERGRDGGALAYRTRPNGMATTLHGSRAGKCTLIISVDLSEKKGSIHAEIIVSEVVFQILPSGVAATALAELSPGGALMHGYTQQQLHREYCACV